MRIFNLFKFPSEVYNMSQQLQKLIEANQAQNEAIANLIGLVTELSIKLDRARAGQAAGDSAIAELTELEMLAENAESNTAAIKDILKMHRHVVVPARTVEELQQEDEAPNYEQAEQEQPEQPEPTKPASNGGLHIHIPPFK